jgi:hypothetical protein
MVQRRGSAGFAAEALQRQRIAGNVVGQELQGDKAAQAGILGLVDDAHAAAAAELFNDSVVGDGLANHPGNAWLSGRFILRTRYRYVNEW